MQNIKKIAVLSGGMLIAALFMTACQEEKAPVKESEAQTSAALSQETLAQRGKYLVDAIGCDDCHTPKMMTDQGPVPDPSLRLSGHPAGLEIPPADVAMLGPGHWSAMFNDHMTAIFGPWGVSFAANLTSDNTGIGLWTEEQFIRAIREGKLKGLEGSRPLHPPMPWPAYRNLTDEDLKAIFAFLKTVPPIENVVPQPVTPDMLASAAGK